MKAKHTPPPWEVSKHGTPEWCPQFGIYAGDQADHAIIKGENADADAHLMAAAPVMLTELRETVKDLREWDGTDEAMSIIIANLETAIAKATQS